MTVQHNTGQRGDDVMKIFKINNRIEIECEWKKTRIAFKHTAVLLVDGHKADETKVCYQNRTWESYEFQSVMERLIDKTKALTKDEKEEAKKFIKEYRETGTFDGLRMVAAFGDILCDTPKEKNDWKKRMMKASLGGGVNFPDEWDRLPEEEKTRRLDGALGALK